MRGAFGLLDRYVALRFLGAYGVCVFGFLSLFLVVDIPRDLGDFQDAAEAIQQSGRTPLGVGVEFYASKLPGIMTFVGPFLTLFAAIVTALSLGRHGELTPMILAGRSPHRVLAPVYGLALLLMLALVGVEEYLVPQSGVRLTALKALLEGEHESRELHSFSTGGNSYSASEWRPVEQALVGLGCLDWRDPDGLLPRGSLDVEQVEYGKLVTTGAVGWFPRGGTLRPSDLDASGRPQQPLALPFDRPLPLGFTPTELDLLTTEHPTALPRADLLRLIERYPANRHLRMELHARWTRPLASLLLLLVGLPFVMRPGHHSIPQGLAVALVASLCYFLTHLLFYELGSRGDVVPLAAAWMPSVIFGALAVSRLETVGR